MPKLPYPVPTEERQPRTPGNQSSIFGESPAAYGLPGLPGMVSRITSAAWSLLAP